MHEAVKNITRLAPKGKLIMKTKKGLTSNQKKESRFIQTGHQCRTYYKH